MKASMEKNKDQGKGVFPMASVTNYHKLSGLKKHTFIIYCSSKGQMSKICLRV